MKRLHAISVMFSSVLLASIHVLVVLSLPLTYLVHFDGAGIHWAALMFFVLVAIWALANAFGARKGARLDDRRCVLGTLWDTYRYIAMFLPMAWYYFVGGVRALFGVYDDFHRTPKGKDAYRQIMPRINSVLLLGEVVTFLYSLFATYVALHRGNYFLVPLNVTVCVGFGMVLYWSWAERRARGDASVPIQAGKRRQFIKRGHSSPMNRVSLQKIAENRRENSTSENAKISEK